MPEHAVGAVLPTLPASDRVLIDSIDRKGARRMERDEVHVLLARSRVAGADGRWREAEELLREAVRISEDRHGMDHTSMIEPLVLLGRAHRQQGGTEEAVNALSIQERALAIAETSDPSQLCYVLTALALTCEQAKRVEEAVAHLRRALDIQHAAKGETSFLLVNMIHILLRAGRGAEALPFCTQALERASQGGASNEDLLGPVIDLGLCLRDAGDLVAALDAFRRALDIAAARKDEPSLREARAEALREIRGWIEETERRIALSGA